MKGACSIFRFLLDASSRGEGTALITVTGIEGSSSRAIGTHMAVSETGAWSGSLSGGCVEAAVVAEAKRIIATDQTQLVRYGAGSPYIDVRLPCGGGLDLLFTPNPPANMLRPAYERLSTRSPVSLLLVRDGRVSVRASVLDDKIGWIDDTFLVQHDPDLRLLIVGHGEEAICLAALASTFGAEVTVLTPDVRVADAVARNGLPVKQLQTPRRTSHLVTDPYTAVVLLFHNHDWEPELLGQALESEAFFVGAMGSRRTHAKRIEILRENGIRASSIARLVAPLGLIPSTRDPDTLALSILSQIAALRSGRASAACKQNESKATFSNPAEDVATSLQGDGVDYGALAP
jgi:xanthine dehydrogenase accessory factor